MRLVPGYILEATPIEQLKKVSNLIEFEGPLLSHYSDKYNHNYLFYWVDQDELNNRWLVWKVEEHFLYLYIAGDIPLDHLFPKEGEQLFMIDIDYNLTHTKTVLCYSDQIDEAYRPEEQSFFNFEIPEVYKEKIQVGSLLETYKEKALYLNIQTASKRYDTTVGIQDAWTIMQSIAKSFSEYVQYSVNNILGQRITDKNRILTAVKSLSSINRLRIVYLNLNSFHIGVAADSLNINSVAMDPSIESFGNTALQSFKQEILDNDFSSTDDVNILVKKYPDENVRHKIFDPIIAIINNDNIRINITDYTKTFDKSYNRVSKNEQNALLPGKPKMILQEESGKTLIVAYIVADKDSAQGTLFPKDITGRVMYTKETNTFPFELNKLLLHNGQEIVFSHPIILEGTFENDVSSLEYPALGIYISANNKKDLEEAFLDQFRKLYLQYKEGEFTFSKIFEDLLGT